MSDPLKPALQEVACFRYQYWELNSGPTTLYFNHSAITSVLWDNLFVYCKVLSLVLD